MPSRLLGPNLRGGWFAGSCRFPKRSGRFAPDGDGRGDSRADRLLRVCHHARHHAADDHPVYRPQRRGLLRHHQGPGTPGHSLRTAQRRRRNHGAEGQGHPAAHEARRRRPAQGRRRRLRDLRQIRRARHHELRPEHQSSARARGRTCPHHPRHRPRPGGASPSGAAGAAAVFARNARTIGLDRGARARRARTAADQGHSPPGRLRRQRPEAAAGVDRRRSRSIARRRRQRRRRQRRRRRAPRRLREADAQSGRGDRVVGGRSGPRPRPALGRLRLQQDHPDLGPLRSRRPGAALEPDPGRILGNRRQQRSGHGQQRIAGQSRTRTTRRPRATRARRPRKPTTTRFPAPPRPK